MKKFELSLLIGLCITVILGSFTTFAADCDEIRGDVLRLHILANSDTAEDQALKLKVRDAVLENYSDIFNAPNTLDEAKQNAANHLDDITALAEKVIAENGYSYSVQVQMVNMYFETRQYDDFTLPAGMYDAVRITIGEAKGHNWWCVLYPPLCVNAAKSSNIINNTMNQDEADLVTRNPKYEVRFAVVEWFENLMK